MMKQRASEDPLSQGCKGLWVILQAGPLPQPSRAQAGQYLLPEVLRSLSSNLTQTAWAALPVPVLFKNLFSFSLTLICSVEGIK